MARALQFHHILIVFMAMLHSPVIPSRISRTVDSFLYKCQFYVLQKTRGQQTVIGAVENIVRVFTYFGISKNRLLESTVYYVYGIQHLHTE